MARFKMVQGWKPGDPPRTLKVKRGGGSKNSNSGPSGYQMRPGPRHYKALADMASGFGVINGVKRADAIAALIKKRAALRQDVRTGMRNASL